MNFSFIGLAIFLFSTASLHAKLEIEVEGKHGWAENLPTKKYTGALAKMFSEHGYITSYHIFNIMIVAALAHFPLFFVNGWTFNFEFFVVGFIVLHFILEDFLWFVYNPAFGIKNFRKKKIWWHKYWFLGLPASYWISIPIGLLLMFFVRS